MEQKVSHGAGIHHPGDASSLDQRGTQLTRLVGHVDGGPLHLIPVSPQQSVGLGMDHHTTRGGVAHPRSGRRSRSGARTIQAGGFTWGRSIEPCSNDCAPLNNNCPNPSTLTLSPRRYGLGDPQIIRVPVRTHDASALAYKPDTCDIPASSESGGGTHLSRHIQHSSGVQAGVIRQHGHTRFASSHRTPTHPGFTSRSARSHTPRPRPEPHRLLLPPRLPSAPSL